MRHTTHTTRSATIAIAAMLALGPTSALAQTAPANDTAQPTDPVVILPAPMVDPVAPAVQSRQAPTTVSRPVVQSVPVAPEPTVEQPVIEDTVPAPVAAPANRTNASSRSAAPAPVGSNMTDTDATQTSNEVSLPLEEETGAAELAPLPLPVADTATPQQQGSSAFDWAAFAALALAGLIPISLLAMAIIWWRRRSRLAEAIPAKTVTERKREPIVAKQPAVEQPATAPAPVIDAEPTVPVDTPLPFARQTRTKPTAPRGQVILPNKVPDSFEARDTLLRRMVEATPDRANPFRSPKARARRARLIIQSLGRDFKRAAPRMDLSQYSYLWPHLADTRGVKQAA